MEEEIKDSTDEKEQSQPAISISREAMEKAIAAFPQSKLNRTTTNASFLGIPQRNVRSDSDISVSVVEKLRTLRTKFTERTELIKAKEIEKIEISENESDEDETCTDPTKSDENELQLGGEFKTTEIQKEKSIGWWKRYPNRKLIIRQPLCLMCLPSSRKYFISKPNLPCFSIQNPEDNEKQQKEEVKVIKASEQETEQRNIYLLWLGFLLIAVLYNYITIPFREAFNIYDDEDNMTLWYILNSLMDTLYLLDILLLKPRIEFLDQGITKTDFKSCALHYFKSLQFKIDIISIIPLDLFSLFYEKDMARFRVFRLVKINAFWEAFEKLDQRLNAGYAVRLARTIIYMIYIIHLETCGYYAFNRWQGLGETSWTIQPGPISPYVYSFYVCMKTATSIGSLPAATNSSEFLFMTCYWLSGILVSAILIGQVIDILDSASANKVNYRKVMDATLSSMQQLHAPQHVVDKVRSWFMYNWDQQKTFNENSLFECLPIKLKSDLAISVHFHTLSKVTLFQGEVGKEMYIVKSGAVEVVGGPNNSIVFVTLKEGSVFGEISLLALSGKNRRTADVRSKGFSTLFSLSKQDFEEIMKNYPQAHELLKKRSQRMLSRDKKKATDEAVKEKKKLQKEKSCELNYGDEAVIEVIPERPATPKLIETVVKVIESTYPDKMIARRLKGSFSSELGTRRRSIYTVKPSVNMVTNKKSSISNINDDNTINCNEKETETVPISNSIPCQNELHNQKLPDTLPKEETNNHDEDESDKQSENFDQSVVTERTTQHWIDMLSVDRNPIKRITSYFPHIC
ncbi:unnamed protein product [Schistosoma margrebowiei]|uniref:Uncharacterized protein n=1 Tax=Schistosoma margrebowiei TaxID=48269 RepID=A0A183MLC5_9TREM|nr:unnamed protein product [Schistosoma margrebowiei]